MTLPTALSIASRMIAAVAHPPTIRPRRRVVRTTTWKVAAPTAIAIPGDAVPAAAATPKSMRSTTRTVRGHRRRHGKIAIGRSTRTRVRGPVGRSSATGTGAKAAARTTSPMITSGSHAGSRGCGSAGTSGTSSCWVTTPVCPRAEAAASPARGTAGYCGCGTEVSALAGRAGHARPRRLGIAHLEWRPHVHPDLSDQ